MKKKKEPKERKVGYGQMLKVFLRSVREYKKDSILAALFITFETVFECVIPFVMSMLLTFMEKSEGYILNQTMTEGEAMATVGYYSLGLIALAFCSFGCGYTAAKVSAKAAVGFATNLRKDLFSAVSRFSFANIDKFSTSSLVTRQTTDITYIQLSYMLMIRIALRAPLMFIFSLVMAIIQSPELAWVFAITIPVLAVVLVLLIGNVIPVFNKVFKKLDRLNESVEENVRGIRVVKTYVREDYEKKKFSKASEDIRNGLIVAERLIGMTNPSMYCAMYISMSLVLFGGYTLLVRESATTAITIGQITSLITYGAMILSSLMMLSSVFMMISMSTASMRRVYEVLVEKPTISNPTNPVMKVEDGSIDFDNVSFKYKPEAEKYALKDIDLHIKSGQTVGIIGSTGSSKSTLVNLISRFYDVSQGDVKVGGVDVRDYDITTLRNAVGMVLQKNVLFSGTIKSNLLWGNKDASDDEIKKACDIAQASLFVESFPDKYNSEILQGGTNVSGGQKQRLCLARAIIKKPKILILDDSTSAVDTKTDALIRQGLKDTLTNTTKIIIAQRVSSVKDADMILVMDDGKIVDKGTHDYLVQNCSIYKEINDIQNRVGGAQNV